VNSGSTETRRKLGYLPENNPLYTDLYIKEYLQYVAGLYKMGSKTNDRVNEVIKLTGLEPEISKKIGLLSKGYRQRVGLAQAIIHDPEILILDEPTTGLDPIQIVEIRNLISELGKEKTVILSTHIMQEVEAICPRVIMLNKGLVVADGLTGSIGGANTGSQTVIVEFGEDIEENIFGELSGISKVKKLKTGTWLIETASNADIREDLFRLAVKKNLVILSLHRKDKRLEDVFRELTA
jgi:ABC-2 type transport system ATP-binding protein